MENFDNTVKNYTSWLDNPYVSGALTVFLIVYASMAAPKLPNYIARLFDYTLFKLFIFFLIVYVIKHNATVAIIAAIALMVSIMTLERLKCKVEMMEVVNDDSRLNRRLKLDSCTCDCGAGDIIKTEEGHYVFHEAKKLEAEEVLHPVQVEEITQEIVHAEKNGVPVLVARTEEGAKHMQEIAKAESNGLMSEDDAKKLVAKIVVSEIVSETKVQPEQEHQSQQIIHEEVSNGPKMAEMAQEVLKRKQEETERTGVEPTGEDLRKLCAGVLAEYRQSCGMNNQCGKKVHLVPGFDATESSYSSV